MIVDCHVNIFEDRHRDDTYDEKRKTMRPGFSGNKADADTLYAAMAKVDKAIIFTLRYGDAVGVEGDDGTTAAAVTKYSDKFVGFAYVDPRRLDCMELLRRAHQDLGLRGVKFGPIYNAVALDDPRLTPVYEYLVAHDMPLTMHMGTTFTRPTPVDLGRPIHVEPLALKYPDLKIIMAHMGHPWCEDCIVIIRKQPNVYAEVSGLYYRPWQFYNMLICAQEYMVTHKMFWGTDFPVTTVEESVEGLRNANQLIEGTALPRVSEETIEGILHSNPFAHWWHGDPPA